jgi:hypothetical protein
MCRFLFAIRFCTGWDLGFPNGYRTISRVLFQRAAWRSTSEYAISTTLRGIGLFWVYFSISAELQLDFNINFYSAIVISSSSLLKGPEAELTKDSRTVKKFFVKYFLKKGNSAAFHSIFIGLGYSISWLSEFLYEGINLADAVVFFCSLCRVCLISGADRPLL